MLENALHSPLSLNYLIRFLINIVTVFILVRFLYYPTNRNREFVFSYMLFNFIVFNLCFFLHKIEIQLGFGFGLFAIFSMLRYRTESISIKEMTYLLLSIALGMLLAIANLSHLELGIIAASTLLMTLLVGSNFFLKPELKRTVQYEVIENIKPENRQKLIADLEDRLGLSIHRLVVKRIDFLRDTAMVTVYYYEESSAM